MGHHSHTNPLTRKSTLCKICKSNICKEIEQALANGMLVKDVITLAEKAQPGIDLRKWNVSTHRRKHMFPTEKKQMKIIDIKEGKKGESDAGGLTDEHLLSLSSFLDLVIEKVNTAITKGDVVPTVAEGVKAAEIKAKVKESTKFEKELVKFFTEISLKHGYSS